MSTISIHSGDAGIKQGFSQWQLFKAEYESSPTETQRPESFYFERSSGVYQPRALFVDTDPSDFGMIQNKNKDLSFQQE